MNRTSQHPPDPMTPADAAFSRYFRAQLPTQWPAAPIPAYAAPKLPARSGSWRTRLTLGASVAALLVFGFAFSYGPGTSQPENKNGDMLKTGTADGNKLKEKMKDDKFIEMP